MPIYVYKEGDDTHDGYDFTVTQEGHLSPKPPTRFKPHESLTVLLQDGVHVPTEQQMVAIDTLQRAFMPPVFYAFKPAKLAVPKPSRRKWYTEDIV